MKHLLVLSLVLGLAACSGKQSYVASAPWKDTDKHLPCDKLLLEMNDAKFWMGVAERNKSFGVTDAVFPVSYINTKASADEAIAAASSRLSHLNNIYQIKGCNKPYADMPTQAPANLVPPSQ
jgi:hypothetical protein